VTNLHQLPDEWLLSYGAGALSFGRSLMVGSQIAYHDDMQATVADAEVIGGALLDSIDSSAVGDTVLDQVLDRLEHAPRPRPEVARGAKDIFPEPLADFIDTGLESLNWRFMGPGMRNARLWNGPNDERLWLLRARGGAQIPEHGHNGDEWTLVLKGAFQTPDGHFKVGDIDIADEQVVHQPVIDDGEECICLVFTHKPIRLNGLVARMMQPFIGL
jgi:putative transcriptional regulator